MSTLPFNERLPNLDLLHQGKVCDTYFLPGYTNLRLPVRTDRVSTHNFLHKSLIQDKGSILTALSIFWMDILKRELGLKTHIVAYGKNIYDYLPGNPADYPADLHLRAVVAENLQMIPIEFIFRRRMVGSLWSEYYSKGLPNPYGIQLPNDLKLMSEFSKTIFTPTDKSATDEPLLTRDVCSEHGNVVRFMENVYNLGRKHALSKGVDIADGKGEVGSDLRGRIVLADEWLTPDCCRFVDADSIEIGQEPLWLDKEFLRQEAVRIWAGGKKHPLQFSSEICAQTTARYHEILERLTDKSLSDLQNSLGMN